MAGSQPVPFKLEPLPVSHVEQVVHQVQPLLAAKRLGRHAQLVEVVQNICLDVLQPGLGGFQILRLNAKGQIFGLGEAVVALGQLASEHGRILGPDIVEAVVPGRNADAPGKGVGIGGAVHKGKLKVDAGIEEMQEGAPLIEDCGLILLLGQLVVHIPELNGLAVIPGRDPANAIRKHPLKRDGLLGRPGNAVISSGALQNGAYLSFLLPCEIGRKRNLSLSGAACGFSLLSFEQCGLPPFLPDAGASGRRNSCLFYRAGMWAE